MSGKQAARSTGVGKVKFLMIFAEVQRVGRNDGPDCCPFIKRKSHVNHISVSDLDLRQVLDTAFRVRYCLPPCNRVVANYFWQDRVRRKAKKNVVKRNTHIFNMKERLLDRLYRR